jgi:hypothetical protein
MKTILCVLLQKELKKRLKDDVFIHIHSNTLYVDIIDKAGNNCRYIKESISQEITSTDTVKTLTNDILNHYVKYIVSLHFF